MSLFLAGIDSGRVVNLNIEIDEGRSRLRLIVNWIVDVAVVISIAWFTVFSLGTQVPVAGQSMTPVLESEEIVLMNRLLYHIRMPERFDIVVFEREDNKFNIKRVVGLPGETLQVKDGFLYINDEKIDARDGLNQVALAGLLEHPVRLAEDEYFLLGDNRDNSEDSRFANVGNVKRNQIKGKIWFRISPLKRFGFISF